MVRLKPAPPVIWMVSLGATGTTPRMVPFTAWANAPPANANATDPLIAKASALRWNMRLREARQEWTFMRRAPPRGHTARTRVRLSPWRAHTTAPDYALAARQVVRRGLHRPS